VPIFFFEKRFDLLLNHYIVIGLNQIKTKHSNCDCTSCDCVSMRLRMNKFLSKRL